MFFNNGPIKFFKILGSVNRPSEILLKENGAQDNNKLALLSTLEKLGLMPLIITPVKVF